MNNLGIIVVVKIKTVYLCDVEEVEGTVEVDTIWCREEVEDHKTVEKL